MVIRRVVLDFWIAVVCAGMDLEDQGTLPISYTEWSDLCIM